MDNSIFATIENYDAQTGLGVLREHDPSKPPIRFHISSMRGGVVPEPGMLVRFSPSVWASCIEPQDVSGK